VKITYPVYSWHGSCYYSFLCFWP